jgi:hypothetical protein
MCIQIRCVASTVSNEAVLKAIDCHLQTDEMELYCKGLLSLLEQWQKCIDQDGDFVEK